MCVYISACACLTLQAQLVVEDNEDDTFVNRLTTAVKQEASKLARTAQNTAIESSFVCNVMHVLLFPS